MSVNVGRLWSVAVLTLACMGAAAQEPAAERPATTAAGADTPATTKEEPAKAQPDKPLTRSEALMKQLGEALDAARVRALRRAFLDKEPEEADPTPQVIDAYRKIVGDPDSARLLIASHLADYMANKERAKSAPQASQVAGQTSVELQIIMIMQNQRIIELLERRARGN